MTTHALKLTAKEYRRLSLYTLLERIVQQGDGEALNEFHTHRRVLGDEDSEYIRFSEYVSRLVRLHSSTHSDDALERASDLVVDRFTRLSDSGGIDCRKYFASALENQDTSHPLHENLLCYRLTGLIRRHFRLGLKEAYRGGTRSRYVWEKEGVRLDLLFPRELSGQHRKAWLEMHAGEVDMHAWDARTVIQSIIDEELGHTLHYSLDASPNLLNRLCAPASPVDYLDRIGVLGLAKAVAEEKSEILDLQRSAIRRLGSEGLKNLIIEIFEGIGHEGYEERKLAQRFGISPATFSRFAGSRWKPGSETMPDLWRNLAQLLAFDVRFVGLCEEAGIVSFLNKVVTED